MDGDIINSHWSFFSELVDNKVCYDSTKRRRVTPQLPTQKVTP